MSFVFLNRKNVVRSPVLYLLNGRIFFLCLLGILLLTTALSVVWAKQLGRSLYIELQKLQKARDELHVEWTQLLLEQSTLASDVRVERIARETLKMRIPSFEQTVVIKP